MMVSFSCNADGYDPLDPNGNLTIRWDILQENDDGTQDVSIFTMIYTYPEVWLMLYVCLVIVSYQNISKVQIVKPGEWLWFKSHSCLRPIENEVYLTYLWHYFCFYAV